MLDEDEYRCKGRAYCPLLDPVGGRGHSATMKNTHLPQLPHYSRTFVLSLALLGLTATGSLSAADATPATAAPATVGGATEPAANQAFLARISDMSSKLIGEANGALSNAKSVGGALGGFGSFGGASAKASSATTSAQTMVDKATGLKSDVDSLRAGKPISSTGVYATLTNAASSAASSSTAASSTSGSSFTDTFKGLPLASAMQTVLGNQQVSSSLLSGLPVDKVPGYSVAADALSKAGF